MTTARPVITRGASPVQGLVRIVLVDDHAILRQGLRSVLERESDLEIVGGERRPSPRPSPWSTRSARTSS